MSALPVTSGLLQELNEAIEERRVQEGIGLLRRVDCKQIDLSASGKLEPAFLLCLAQWVTWATSLRNW